MIKIKKEQYLAFFKKHWLEILLIIIMATLIFVNLAWRHFAGDEGYNVTMGQYILKNNGIPRVWDGKNIITTINGNDFNEDFMCINLNWGAYYITAFAQLIFGKNHYLIRMFFAIMGLASAIVWYKYARTIVDKKTSKIFLMIYCLSIPIIIYIRNANYFAPSLLLIGLMFLYYKKGTLVNNKFYLSCFIFFSFLQFHVNYMLFIFAIIPILFDYILTARFHKTFFISYGIIFLTTIPFFLWMRYNFSLIGSSYRNVVPLSFIDGYYRFVEQVWHISFYIAPIIPLLIIFLISCLLYKTKKNLLSIICL